MNQEIETKHLEALERLGSMIKDGEKTRWAEGMDVWIRPRSIQQAVKWGNIKNC
jgi:hypothetical protein